MTMPRLSGSPERIFISVDEHTGKATLSFFPAEVSAPYQLEDDATGERSLKDAKEIAAKYPGCTIQGPHFHNSATARPRMRKRPPAPR